MPTVLDGLVVLLAGVLAGEELVVRWGLQPAMASLEERAAIEVRQAVIRRLRVLVPSVMLPTAILAAVALITGDAGGAPYRVAGSACVALFVLASFLGTVPINIRVDGWDPGAPPVDWRRTILRWQRIDVLRSTAAFAGFTLLLAGVVLH